MPGCPPGSYTYVCVRVCSCVHIMSTYVCCNWDLVCVCVYSCVHITCMLQTCGVTLKLDVYECNQLTVGLLIVEETARFEGWYPRKVTCRLPL